LDVATDKKYLINVFIIALTKAIYHRFELVGNLNMQITPWIIEIFNLETKLRVGIWEHELDFQPIHINISIHAIAPAFPQAIDDCINYQPICSWITNDWPRQKHTPLLETKLFELMRFVFDFDSRIESADISISKTKAIQEAQRVGVRMDMSRSEFENILLAQNEKISLVADQTA